MIIIGCKNKTQCNCNNFNVIYLYQTKRLFERTSIGFISTICSQLKRIYMGLAAFIRLYKYWYGKKGPCEMKNKRKFILFLELCKSLRPNISVHSSVFVFLHFLFLNFFLYFFFPFPSFSLTFAANDFNTLAQ